MNLYTIALGQRFWANGKRGWLAPPPPVEGSANCLIAFEGGEPVPFDGEVALREVLQLRASARRTAGKPDDTEELVARYMVSE